jgi:hypothetical protein
LCVKLALEVPFDRLNVLYPPVAVTGIQIFSIGNQPVVVIDDNDFIACRLYLVAILLRKTRPGRYDPESFFTYFGRGALRFFFALAFPA